MMVHIVYSYSWPETEIEGVFSSEHDANRFISAQELSECYYSESWDVDTYKKHIDNFHSEIVKL